MKRKRNKMGINKCLYCKYFEPKKQGGITLNKENLISVLSRYFSIGDSYTYNLTRDKSAFSVGTMSLDDFEEFDENTIEDLVEYIIQNMDIPHWVDTKKQLPDVGEDVLMKFASGNMAAGFLSSKDEERTYWCAYTDDGWYTDCDAEPTCWMKQN